MNHLKSYSKIEEPLIYYKSNKEGYHSINFEVDENCILSLYFQTANTVNFSVNYKISELLICIGKPYFTTLVKIPKQRVILGKINTNQVKLKFKDQKKIKKMYLQIYKDSLIMEELIIMIS